MADGDEVGVSPPAGEPRPFGAQHQVSGILQARGYRGRQGCMVMQAAHCPPMPLFVERRSHPDLYNGVGWSGLEGWLTPHVVALGNAGPERRHRSARVPSASTGSTWPFYAAAFASSLEFRSVRSGIRKGLGSSLLRIPAL